MNRREVIAGLAMPLLARAAWGQQPNKVYQLFAVGQDDPSWRTDPGALVFFDEMRKRGWEEGKNFVIERSSRQGRSDAEMARDVVRSQPDVIVTWDTGLAKQLRQATAAIPIVSLGSDPVANGLALTVARPGGNVTGTFTSIDVSGKFLELLRQLDPRITRVGYLASAEVWDNPFSLKMRKFASEIGVTLIGPALQFPMDDAEYRRVLAEILSQHPDALIVSSFAENYAHRPLIIEFVAQARLPTFYYGPFWVREGGLMTYTPDGLEHFRRAAEIVDKIFRGGNPAEIPFQQLDRYMLLLNLKTATAIGLTFPPSLLVRADEVIE